MTWTVYMIVCNFQLGTCEPLHFVTPKTAEACQKVVQAATKVMPKVNAQAPAGKNFEIVAYRCWRTLK